MDLACGRGRSAAAAAAEETPMYTAPATSQLPPFSPPLPLFRLLALPPSQKTTFQLLHIDAKGDSLLPLLSSWRIVQRVTWSLCTVTTHVFAIHYPLHCLQAQYDCRACCVPGLVTFVVASRYAGSGHAGHGHNKSTGCSEAEGTLMETFPAQPPLPLAVRQPSLYDWHASGTKI